MMRIDFTQNSFGRHTEVSYSDKDGAPLAARFPGWLQPHEVEDTINYYRKHDRNRGVTA